MKSPLLTCLTGDLFTGPYCPSLLCLLLPSLPCKMLDSKREFCMADQQSLGTNSGKFTLSSRGSASFLL